MSQAQAPAPPRLPGIQVNIAALERDCGNIARRQITLEQSMSEIGQWLQMLTESHMALKQRIEGVVDIVNDAAPPDGETVAPVPATS